LFSCNARVWRTNEDIDLQLIMYKACPEQTNVLNEHFERNVK